MLGSPLPCRVRSAAHAAQSRHQLHAARAPCSTARKQLVCRAILSGKDHSKDVKRRAESAVAKAAADEAAVPLPNPAGQAPSGPDAVASEAERAVNIVDAVLDSVIKAPYRWYCRSLEAHPLTTKACTSLVGFMLGDLLAQHMSHPGATDILRVLRLGAYGLLIDGPVGALWYDLLEKVVDPEQPTGTRAVLIKTALDQLVYATIMTAVYFALIRTWEGHPETIIATLQAKFWPTLAANYAIWPLAHIINFKFVPSQFRILYNNVVCVAWLTYLSLATHTKMPLFFFLQHHS